MNVIYEVIDMNKDIIVPEFKLSQRFPILVHRRVVSSDEKFPNLQNVTPSIYANVPTDVLNEWIQVYILNLPPEVVNLFISVMGRQMFYDEICLCVSLNIPTFVTSLGIEANLNNPPSAYRAVILVLYNELVRIITTVVTLSVGMKGERRKLYQYYFFTGKVPDIKDNVFKSTFGNIDLSKIVLSEIRTPDGLRNVKTSLVTLQQNIFSLSSHDETLVVDLLSLSLSDFNLLVKMLPKDTVFLKMYKERIEFFDSISSAFEKLLDSCDKLLSLFVLYEKLKNKFNSNYDGMNITELQKLYDMENKNVINNSIDKLYTGVTKINTFVEYYNINKVYKFKDTTLTSPIPMINEMLSSSFFTFLNNFKAMHKEKLRSTLESALPSAMPMPSAMPSAFTPMPSAPPPVVSKVEPMEVYTESPPQTTYDSVLEKTSVDESGIAAKKSKLEQDIEELKENQQKTIDKLDVMSAEQLDFQIDVVDSIDRIETSLVV